MYSTFGRVREIFIFVGLNYVLEKRASIGGARLDINSNREFSSREKLYFGGCSWMNNFSS